MNGSSDNTHENVQSRDGNEGAESSNSLSRRDSSHFELANSPSDNVHDLMGVSEADRETIEEMKAMSSDGFAFGSFDTFGSHNEDEPPFKKMKVEESFIPINDEISSAGEKVRAEDVILDDINKFGQEPDFTKHKDDASDIEGPNHDKIDSLHNSDSTKHKDDVSDIEEHGHDIEKHNHDKNDSLQNPDFIKHKDDASDDKNNSLQNPDFTKDDASDDKNNSLQNSDFTKHKDDAPDDKNDSLQNPDFTKHKDDASDIEKHNHDKSDTLHHNQPQTLHEGKSPQTSVDPVSKNDPEIRNTMKHEPDYEQRRDEHATHDGSSDSKQPQPQPNASAVISADEDRFAARSQNEPNYNMSSDQDIPSTRASTSSQHKDSPMASSKSTTDKEPHASPSPAINQHDMVETIQKNTLRIPNAPSKHVAPHVKTEVHDSQSPQPHISPPNQQSSLPKNGVLSEPAGGRDLDTTHSPHIPSPNQGPLESSKASIASRQPSISNTAQAELPAITDSTKDQRLPKSSLGASPGISPAHTESSNNAPDTSQLAGSLSTSSAHIINKTSTKSENQNNEDTASVEQGMPNRTTIQSNSAPVTSHMYVGPKSNSPSQLTEQHDLSSYQSNSDNQPASKPPSNTANSGSIAYSDNHASNLGKPLSTSSTIKSEYKTENSSNPSMPSYDKSISSNPNSAPQAQPSQSKPYSPSFSNNTGTNPPSHLNRGIGSAPISPYDPATAPGASSASNNHGADSQIPPPPPSSSSHISNQTFNNSSFNTNSFQSSRSGPASQRPAAQSPAASSPHGINHPVNYSGPASTSSQSRTPGTSSLLANGHSNGYNSSEPHHQPGTNFPVNGQVNGQVNASSPFNPTPTHIGAQYLSNPGPSLAKPPIVPPVTAPSPPKPLIKRHRLVVIYDKPRFTHMRTLLDSLKRLDYETCTILELGALGKLKEPELIKRKFDCLSFAIEYNDEFEHNLKSMTDFIEAEPKLINEVSEIAYHFHFDHRKKWSEYREFEKQEYKRFLDVLSKFAGNKVVQCSIINKYELGTIYLTERNDLAKLGQEIQEDIQNWPNLKIFDYGENFIRFLPGVRFPDSLEVINIGGGFSLETLTGFKMPPNLKALFACSGSISSIDNAVFPATLERLSLVDNKIYFLNLVEFPSRLINLDISQNRIESLKGVNFPKTLKSLAVSFNPIECIRGAKFPDGLEYLDVSCIPNESMTGVKFPESLVSLNLQQSMTNTRGLKLPSFLKRVNLGHNGVNSINPLKLPNTIESLYLSHNNIKTLNKVVFPPGLKELYLGNNLITTLKNVQFPAGLEVLDFEMDPDTDDQEKHITTLKDVVFPPSLKVLKLGYHSIKFIETIEFPPALISLSLAYNELKVIRNVKFGNNLKILDLSGNQELTNIDNLIIPESVVDLKIPTQLVNFLPPYIVERANRRQLMISKSSPF